MADTILSEGMTIDGNIEAQGSVRIDGVVQGRVAVQGPLELGPTAQITSDVQGSKVTIAGAVEGNVEGKERVDILAGGKLNGNVRAPRLTIADGAVFRGKVDMEM